MDRKLTARQRQICDLLAKGAGTKQIAGALRISRHTVRSHMYTLLKQLDVKNRTEAVAVYVTARARGVPL